MDSRTLLFGGSGFLGPIILEKYPEIVSAGRTPPPSYVKNKHIPVDIDHLEALDSVDFDKVIFLIGSSNHHEINTKPTMGLDFNVLPLKKALFYFEKKKKIKKFICFTTILLYDVTKMTLPVGETQKINPYINDYVVSKYLSEELVAFYKRKVPSIVVRFSNIYGPTKLIRPDIVPTIIQKCLSPHEVTIWSKKPIRDFLYLDDAADVIVKLLDTDYTGVVNLGSGSSVSIGEIASILERLSGKTIVDLQKDVSGPMNFRTDISLVKRLTGWAPRHSIEEGLGLTFERMRRWAPECRWWETRSATAHSPSFRSLSEQVKSSR